MTKSSLEEIVLMPGPLPVAAPSLPQTGCDIGVQGAKRKFQCALPAMVRHLNAARLGDHWEAFCGLLRSHGVVLKVALADLEPLAAANVPARIGSRMSEEGFSATELQTSDLFELDLCGTERGTGWGWPAEAANTSQLKSLLAAVRLASGSDTPIGITLPLGVHEQDLQACLEQSIDFLSLRSYLPALTKDPSEDCLAIKSLTTIQRMCDKLGQPPPPVLLDICVKEVGDIAKWLALGATCVSIDALLEPLVEHAAAVKPKKAASGGMLGGIAVPEEPKRVALPMSDLDRALHALQERLRRQLLVCGLADVSLLKRDCLRSTTRDMARIAALKRL